MMVFLDFGQTQYTLEQHITCYPEISTRLRRKRLGLCSVLIFHSAQKFLHFARNNHKFVTSQTTKNYLRTKMLLIRVAGRQKTMTRMSAMARLTMK